MKHLKKHPKQQRMEDMVTPDGKFVHKSIKKRNKLIARALDGKKPLDLSGGVHKSKGRPLTISDVDMAHKEYQKHGAISGFPTWYPKEDKTFPLHKPGNCFYHPKELAVVNSETDAYELGITYFGLCQNCIRTRFDGEKVTWEGREWLRSINDDNGFTLMPRIVWRLVAVGWLVGAVIYFLSKVL